jgi:hypothetical protein
VILSREISVKHWATKNSPSLEPNHICWGHIPFPDLLSLSPAERDLLRPVLASRPDILLNEIWCEKDEQ